MQCPTSKQLRADESLQSHHNVSTIRNCGGQSDLQYNSIKTHTRMQMALPARIGILELVSHYCYKLCISHALHGQDVSRDSCTSKY